MGLADSLFTYQTGKVVAIKSKVYVLLSLIARSELHSELQMGSNIPVHLVRQSIDHLLHHPTLCTCFCHWCVFRLKVSLSVVNELG